jgi:hypothetical protein
MRPKMAESNRLQELGAKLKALKTAKKSATELLASINKGIEEITKNDLPEEMSALEIDKVTIKGIGTLSVKADIYASILASNRNAAKDWLVDQGYEDLVTETINASTLKAWAKEYIKQNGEPPPEEIFNITPYEYVDLKS